MVVIRKSNAKPFRSGSTGGVNMKIKAKIGKKVLSVILAFLMLATSFSASAATAKDYENALNMLSLYLTADEEAETVSAEEIVAAFKEQGSFGNSDGFYQYAYLLMCLEKGDYKAADVFKKMLEKNTQFDAYV